MLSYFLSDDRQRISESNDVLIFGASPHLAKPCMMPRRVSVTYLKPTDSAASLGSITVCTDIRFFHEGAAARALIRNLKRTASLLLDSPNGARLGETLARLAAYALATVVHLLETTLIRVGNDDYAKQNSSYGLTTLKNRHVAVDGNEVRFRLPARAASSGHRGSGTRASRKSSGRARICPGKNSSSTWTKTVIARMLHRLR
jgi:hypothetical protein